MSTSTTLTPQSVPPGVDQAASTQHSALGTQHSPAAGVTHPEDAVPGTFSQEDILAARFRVAKVVPYQGASPSFLSNFTLAVLSGLLLVFAFPDWNLWSLGWVGAAPLIMAVARERRVWRCLLLGQTAGTLFYLGTSHWITYSMHHYGGIPLLVAYLIALVFAVGLGFFTALFAGALGLAVRRFGGYAILLAPLMWAASEYARLAVTGVGWNALGYSQAVQPSVIQIARWGGVYIVSALLIAASASLVFALIYLERRRGVVVLTAMIVLGVAAVTYGHSLRRDDSGKETGSVMVAAIQPNVPVDGDWSNPKFFNQMLQRHVTLTEEALRDYRREAAAAATLVIWPESPMTFDYDRDAELRATLADFARRNNVYLLFSSYGADPADAERIFNSAMLLAPSGERISRYDKMVLLPFGEYVPGRAWVPFMDRITAVVGEFAVGPGFTVGDVGGAVLGTHICFETTRPEVARGLRAAGATALVLLSNEAWFGPGAAARQMLATAAFRAVENDVELIRATNSGGAARLDRFGVAHGETLMFETATRLWRVPTTDELGARGLTFYTRHGDVFAIACVAVSLLAVAAAYAAAKLKGKQDDDD